MHSRNPHGKAKAKTHSMCSVRGRPNFCFFLNIDVVFCRTQTINTGHTWKNKIKRNSSVAPLINSTS